MSSEPVDTRNRSVHRTATRQPAETLEPADFFITYAEVDRAWAEWVAWWLELAGYSVILAAWDFRPGHNFVLKMQQAATVARRTIAIFTDDYLSSYYAKQEWAAAFARGAASDDRTLIPIRVKPCAPGGLLSQILCIDLVGVEDEYDAVLMVLEGVRHERGKPMTRPAFPGIPKVIL